jgi:uncharacterized Zn finger protein
VKKRKSGYPKYVSVADRRYYAEVSRNDLRGGGFTLSPVLVAGRGKLSWWAKSWNQCLENFAEGDSRLGRGRSYARNGSILDLQIGIGKVTALVQGSQRRPYKVSIHITPLTGPKIAALQQACLGQLQSADALLSGQFPEALQSWFSQEAHGLFPNLRQIKFECSCPDYASMCKHIAATLYGVGYRLETDPALFFSLRGVAIESLLANVVTTRLDALLAAKGESKSKLLKADDTALEALFGLDFESKAEKPKAVKSKSVKKRSSAR